MLPREVNTEGRILDGRDLLGDLPEDGLPLLLSLREGGCVAREQRLSVARGRVEVSFESGPLAKERHCLLFVARHPQVSAQLLHDDPRRQEGSPNSKLADRTLAPV